MIKILQYGEGNFLRTFVDVYFDELNKREQGEYEVSVVKPIQFGSLERFEKQRNKYHVVLRGIENGRTVENVYKVDSIKNAIDPFVDYEKYTSLAKDEELKIIVSNTTEAGICFNNSDKIDGFDGRVELPNSPYHLRIPRDFHLDEPLPFRHYYSRYRHRRNQIRRYLFHSAILSR